LGHEEAPREESTGLLAERDDGLPAHAPPSPSAGGTPSEVRAGAALTAMRDPRVACSTRLRAMHAAQPMRLYQRYPMLREKNITITRVWAATAAKNTAWPPTWRRKNATRKIPRTTP